MIKILLGLAVSLFVALPAMAQSQTDPRLELLLQQLAALQAQQPEASRAVVTRSAKVRFRITVDAETITGQFPSHNARCDVSISHFTTAGRFYRETKTIELAGPGFGQTLTCDQTIPFRWTEADDTRGVSIDVVVRNSHDNGKDEPSRTRFSSRSLPPIPLPAEGQTAFVSDTIFW
jgi:hypothetical protein